MNIVVVEINYRVGPYGFIAGSEIESANNGLRDQRKALEWVQKYIHLFGGNPKHVVMGGDSAGAASVTLQLTAFGGRNDNLFHGTAAESQSFATVLTVNESHYQYDNLVIRTGCVGASSALSCLKNKTAAEIQAVNFNTPYPGAQAPPLYMWNPVIDSDFITSLTYDAFASGKFVRVPVIFGDDTNGGTIFTPSQHLLLRPIRLVPAKPIPLPNTRATIRNQLHLPPSRTPLQRLRPLLAPSQQRLRRDALPLPGPLLQLRVQQPQHPQLELPLQRRRPRTDRRGVRRAAHG